MEKGDHPRPQRPCSKREKIERGRGGTDREQWKEREAKEGQVEN